jgi:hypothetical protein
MRARFMPLASLVGFWMMAAGAAVADPMTDDLVAQLRGQGFQKVTITRTLLGRVLILGSATEGQREIVLNPNTGEILRDYFRPRSELAATGNGSDGLLVRGLDGDAGDVPDGDNTATGPTDQPGGGRDKSQNGNSGKGAGNNGKTKEK